MAQFIFKHSDGAKSSKIDDLKKQEKDVKNSDNKTNKPKELEKKKENNRPIFKWENVGDYHFDDLAKTVTQNMDLYLDSANFSNKRAASFRVHVSDILDGISKGEIYKDAGGNYIDTTGKRFSSGSFDTNIFGTPKVNSNTSYNDAAYYLDKILPYVNTISEVEEVNDKKKNNKSNNDIEFLDRSGDDNDKNNLRKEVIKDLIEKGIIDPDKIKDSDENIENSKIEAGDDGLQDINFDNSRISFNWFTKDPNKLIEYNTEKGVKFINDFTEESPVYQGLSQYYNQIKDQLNSSIFDNIDYRFSDVQSDDKYRSVLDLSNSIPELKERGLSLYRLNNNMLDGNDKPIFALYNTKYNNDGTINQSVSSKPLYGEISKDIDGNIIFTDSDNNNQILGKYQNTSMPSYAKQISFDDINRDGIYDFVKSNYKDFTFKNLYDYSNTDSILSNDSKAYNSFRQALLKGRGSLFAKNKDADRAGHPEGFRKNKDLSFGSTIVHMKDKDKNGNIINKPYRMRRYKWYNPNDKRELSRDFMWVYEYSPVIKDGNPNSVENARYEVVPQTESNSYLRQRREHNIYKKGGKLFVIKAETGSKIEQSTYEDLQDRNEEIDIKNNTDLNQKYDIKFGEALSLRDPSLDGLRNADNSQNPNYSGVVDLFTNSDLVHKGAEYSKSDKLRTAAAIADLASIAVAFTPFTPAAAATGLGSTAMTATADTMDVKAGKMSTASAIGNGLVNLGLDAISLIPGLKTLKAAKAVKTLLPIAMTAIDLAGIADPATRESYANTFKKIKDMNLAELTGDDISNLTRLSRVILTGKNTISTSNKNYTRREGVFGDQYKYTAEVDGVKKNFFIKANKSVDGKFTADQLIKNTKNVIGVGPDADVKISISSDTSKPLTFVRQGAAEYERKRLAKLFHINKADDAGRGFKKESNSKALSDEPKKWTEAWMIRELDHAKDEGNLKLPKVKLPKVKLPKMPGLPERIKETHSGEWNKGKFVSKKKTKSNKVDAKKATDNKTSEIKEPKTFTAERRSTIKSRLGSQEMLDKHENKFQTVMNRYFGSGKKEGVKFKHDGKVLNQREANKLLSNNLSILDNEYKKAIKLNPNYDFKKAKEATKKESKLSIKEKTKQSAKENFKKAKDYVNKNVSKAVTKMKKSKNKKDTKKIEIDKKKFGGMIERLQQGGVYKPLNHYSSRSLDQFDKSKFRQLLEKDLINSINKYGKEDVMNAFNQIEKYHADYDKLSGNTQANNVFSTNSKYVPSIQNNYKKYFSNADNYLRSNLQGYGKTEGLDKIDDHYGDRTLRRRVFKSEDGKKWFSDLNDKNKWGFNINNLDGYDNGDNYYQLSLSNSDNINSNTKATTQDNSRLLSNPKDFKLDTNIQFRRDANTNIPNLKSTTSQPLKSSVSAGYLKNKKGFEFNPADILETARWAQGRHVNSSGFKDYYNSLKPVFVDSPEYFSPVRGNFLAKQNANNAKGKLYNLAANPSTSDSRVHLNNQLNAASKGLMYDADAATKDSEMFHQSRSMNNDLGMRSHAGRVEAANLNRKNAISMQIAKATAKGNHKIAQYTGMDVPYFSGIEHRLRMNDKIKNYHNSLTSDRMTDSKYSQYLSPLTKKINDGTATYKDELLYKHINNQKMKDIAKARKYYALDNIFGRKKMYQQGGRLSGPERAALNHAKDFNRSVREDNKSFLKSVNDTKKLNSSIVNSMSNLTKMLIKDAMSIK